MEVFVAGPMRPDEVQDARNSLIPEEVFEVFNALIAQAWAGGQALVYQDDVVDRLVARMGISRDEAFRRGLLEVEDAYRRIGWKVEYDKPGYSESYRAYFKFSK